MKKIVVVVADGCVESVFTDLDEEVELEIVDFDSVFPSQDEQESMRYYVDGLRDTMKEI